METWSKCGPTVKKRNAMTSGEKAFLGENWLFILGKRISLSLDCVRANLYNNSCLVYVVLECCISLPWDCVRTSLN
jgi:hypothetical protein